jgi:hypothetical protein
MAVIAVLGVVFALVPMPVAIAIVLLAAYAFLLRRKTPRVPHGSSLGCLFSLLGCPAGVAIGIRLVRRWAIAGQIDVADITLVGGLSGGILGVATALVAAHVVSLAILRQWPTPERRSKSPREALRENIDLVDELLLHAREQGDEEVRTKLEDYKVKLKRDFDLLPVDS